MSWEGAYLFLGPEGVCIVVWVPFSWLAVGFSFTCAVGFLGTDLGLAHVIACQPGNYVSLAGLVPPIGFFLLFFFPSRGV